MKKLLVIVGLLTTTILFAQQHYFHTELLTGAVVPNYLPYPKSGLQQRILVGIGKQHTQKSDWAPYFNLPTTGFLLGFSRIGTAKNFGYSISAVPYISFYPKRTGERKLHFRLGLGAAYFTTPYQRSFENNNKAVGSHFTWAFNALLAHRISQSNSSETLLTTGYFHASNGHTQLPNFGLNSFVIGLMIKTKFKEVTSPAPLVTTKPVKTKDKAWFISLTSGIGFHELGGTSGPVGGIKKPIYESTITIAAQINNHWRLKSGFGYRYYEHYRNHIVQNDISPFNSNPNKGASNVFYQLGMEYLFGHVAFDIIGGLNIYKPFYAEFAEEFEGTNKTDILLKQLFNAKMGLRLYLFNPYEYKKWQPFIGAHINSNFGQADFTSLNIGLLYKTSQ